MPQEYQIPPSGYNSNRESFSYLDRPIEYTSETPIFDEVATRFDHAYDRRSPMYYQASVEYALVAEERRKNREIITAKAHDIKEARKLAMDSVLFIREQHEDSRLRKFAKGLIGTLGLTIFQFSSDGRLKDLTEDDLVRRENDIGATLFVVTPDVFTQTFFYSENDEWVYHRASADGSYQLTTRFIVGDDYTQKITSGSLNGVQLDIDYTAPSGQELQNLDLMVDIYHSRVLRKQYGIIDTSSINKSTDQTDRQITSN